ncbi:MAG: 30S ribosomal protein S4 [Candidatus Pacebacteria bacterium]|nr:30S ribosomal protein S4 [Candidatus Paceibacterota bacterium]MBP9851364.1 30S ribosomal protein S4 [Candidatus Paceibacterota bacterium]
MIKKPKYKVGKRLGAGVYDKCQTPKFSASISNVRPTKRPKALSEFGTQLLEKQKVRFSYGITEKQLSNYVKKASQNKGAGAVEKFYESLELRLDNVVYRMGIACSRREARQMVSHGHFIVHGKKVTVPSYAIKIGDTVTVREGSKSKKTFTTLAEKLKDYTAPAWLNFDVNKMEGKVTAKPKQMDTFLDLNAVFEFYSR